MHKHAHICIKMYEKNSPKMENSSYSTHFASKFTTTNDQSLKMKQKRERKMSRINTRIAHWAAAPTNNMCNLELVLIACYRRCWNMIECLHEPSLQLKITNVKIMWVRTQRFGFISKNKNGRKRRKKKTEKKNVDKRAQEECTKRHQQIEETA